MISRQIDGPLNAGKPHLVVENLHLNDLEHRPKKANRKGTEKENTVHYGKPT